MRELKMTTVLPGFGEVRVVEGVSGTWHYHLAPVDTFVAICGNKDVMNSNMAIYQFGVVPENYHIPLSFCSKCLQHLKPNQTTGTA